MSLSSKTDFPICFCMINSKCCINLKQLCISSISCRLQVVCITGNRCQRRYFCCFLCRRIGSEQNRYQAHNDSCKNTWYAKSECRHRFENSGLRKRKIAHKAQMTTIPMEIPTGIAKRHQLSASFRTKRITCFGVAPIQRIRPKNSVRWATLLFRLLAIIIIPANITSTNNTAAAK